MRTIRQCQLARLGIRVAKVGLDPQDLRSGLMGFLDEHPSDLLVLATHGRDGIARWMHGSIAEELSRIAKLPTLFMPPTGRGFVDHTDGSLHCATLLAPCWQCPPDQ
jgi:nucleotide-binding universal stress UspA family protein